MSKKKTRSMQILIIILVFFLLVINCFDEYRAYETKLIESNATLIQKLLDAHPELEDEIIDIILTEEKNEIESSFLDKYGIGKERLLFSKENDLFKQKIVINRLLIAGEMILVIVGGFFLYHRSEYKKIKDISRYLNEVLKGNYSFDIKDYEEGEISKLKNEVYKVTTRLKEQMEVSKKDKKYLEETLSEISHQLKTPLTSMYVINDLLENDLDDIKRKEFLQKNRNQLQRIEWLVSSLLKISMLDSGVIHMQPKRVLVKDVIDKSLESLRIPMELKNIELIVICPEKLHFQVDKNWLSEALVNILKNATEHVNERGRIEVLVKDNPIYTEIKIKDNGEGIPDKDIRHVFERFYKGGSNKESIGIGLNMAKKIIDVQNGDISVESKHGEYTAFCIKIYKKVG